MTTVVNIRKESFDVYIGRAGHELSGYFGNPFSLANHGKAALVKFKDYFLDRVATDEKFRRRVLELKGKRLGCFCKPGDGFRGRLLCHGQIIAAFVDGVSPEDVE